MRRAGDQLNKPTIRDAVIQKPYYCDHVWRCARDPREVRKSATAIVYLCWECRHRDYKLVDYGKVVIIE